MDFSLAVNQESPDTMEKVFRALRRIQLEVGIFNESNAYTMFSFKTTNISIQIFCGFAAIQLFQVSRVLSAVNAMIVLNAICMFIVTYDKGFAIPRCTKQLKSSLRTKLRLGGLTGGETGRILKEVRSVGNVAIRLGHFHYLQRTSTPNMMDFCFRNTLRLVIAYRK